MTHKLILKVKKFQLSGAKRFGTVEEKPPGGWIPIPPYHLGLKLCEIDDYADNSGPEAVDLSVVFYQKRRTFL